MNERLTIATALLANGGAQAILREPWFWIPAGTNVLGMTAFDLALIAADFLIAREAATRPAEAPAPAQPRRVLLGPDDANFIEAKLADAWNADKPVPSFALTIAGDTVQKVEVAE